MSRATEDLLDQLHALQAKSLLAALRKCEEEGEYSPALLAQINKFLKDNGVDRAVIPGDATDMLDDELPEFDKEGNVIEGKF